MEHSIQEFIEHEMKVSRFPWWEWHIKNNVVRFNPLKVTMLGYSLEEFRNVGYTAFTDLLHPEDHDSTMQAMKNLLEGRAAIYQITYRIRMKSGDYKWYLDRGAPIEWDENGRPLIIRGLVLDVGKLTKPETGINELLNIFKQSSVMASKGKNQLTVCVQCFKVKKDNFTWVHIDQEMIDFLDPDLSHGLCPSCLKELYPDFAGKVIKRIENQ